MTYLNKYFGQIEKPCSGKKPKAWGNGIAVYGDGSFGQGTWMMDTLKGKARIVRTKTLFSKEYEWEFWLGHPNDSKGQITYIATYYGPKNENKIIVKRWIN